MLSAVTRPLGFFVLALLIVEAFLGTVLVGSDLSPDHKYIGMWVGVALFVFVVALVAFFVWKKPRHLMFDQLGHLVDSGKAAYGSNIQPISGLTLRRLENRPEDAE